jgi:hypothetical protein
LIAAVATLAFVVSCTFGAYAHATGHHHNSAGHASQGAATHGGCAGMAPGHVHSTSGQVGHAYVGHGQAGHDRGDPDKSKTDCCGALCHCAHAILVAASVMPYPLLASSPMQPEISLDGAVASGLERPPKPSVPA